MTLWSHGGTQRFHRVLSGRTSATSVSWRRWTVWAMRQQRECIGRGTCSARGNRCWRSQRTGGNTAGRIGNGHGAWLPEATAAARLAREAEGQQASNGTTSALPGQQQRTVMSEGLNVGQSHPSSEGHSHSESHHRLKQGGVDQLGSAMCCRPL